MRFSLAGRCVKKFDFLPWTKKLYGFVKRRLSDDDDASQEMVLI
jgi:hypothetical protein